MGTTMSTKKYNPLTPRTLARGQQTKARAKSVDFSDSRLLEAPPGPQYQTTRCAEQ